MAQRTTDELRVFLEGSIDQYNALTNKAGTVFFDKANHAVYAKGECIIQSNIKDVTYNESSTELTITPFTGSKITINLGIQKELDLLKDNLEDWVADNFASTTILSTELDKKVDKVSGKGLSTNDYTTTEKNKLDGIEPGAQTNRDVLAVDALVGGSNNNEPIVLAGNLVDKSKASSGEVDFNLSMWHDSTNNKIHFFNLPKEQANSSNVDKALFSIDTTDFVKDGILSNAEYNEETHILTLTFNSDAGKAPIPIDLSDLVNVYTAGNGLSLSGTTFSAKLGDGLEFNTYKNITVKYNPNGGITVNAAGVALKAATNGGITVGASGAAVDWTKAPLRTVNGETIADGDVDTTPKVWKFED